MLRIAGPGQIYGDLVSNGFASARFHFCRSSFNHGLRWRVFFRVHHHVCINDTRKCNKCQTFFAKSVKMLTINHILHEFRIFVNIFLRKIVKTVTFTRKVDKNFKTGVILAHFDFFVKKSLMIQLS